MNVVQIIDRSFFKNSASINLTTYIKAQILENYDLSKSFNFLRRNIYEVENILEALFA